MLPTITLIHMSVIPVLAGADDLPGRPRTQDDLRRLRSSPRPRRDGEAVPHDDVDAPRASCCATAPHPAAADLHRRGQQHDRQRPDVAAFARARPRARRAPLRRRRARLRRDRRAGPDELCPTASGQQHRAALRREVRPRRARRRPLEVVLVARWRSSPARPSSRTLLKIAAPPYLYSGPSPVASLATAIAASRSTTQRGDAMRADLYRMTPRVLDAWRSSASTRRTGRATRSSRSRSADPSDIDAVGRFLFDHGIYVTLAAYPLVPSTRSASGSSSPRRTPTRRSSTSSTCSGGCKPLRAWPSGRACGSRRRSRRRRRSRAG